MQIYQKPYLIAIALFIPFLIACGGGESSEDSSDQIEIISQEDNEPLNANGSSTSQVTNILKESGEGESSIEINGEEVIIRYQSLRASMNGRKTKSDKAKYYNEKGDLVAEVKYKDDAFKLRDSNANLLWKIKYKDNKIKISDNEENENPYEIKENDAGKFKIKLGEEQLVEAKLKKGVVTITGSGVYKINSSKNHWAYPVLALGAISEEHRLIIVAELLKRDR